MVQLFEGQIPVLVIEVMEEIDRRLTQMKRQKSSVNLLYEKGRKSLAPVVITEQDSQFNASNLKGQPLF